MSNTTKSKLLDSLLKDKDLMENNNIKISSDTEKSVKRVVMDRNLLDNDVQYVDNQYFEKLNHRSETIFG